MKADLVFPGVGKAIWKHRRAIKEASHDLRLIASLVNSPNDLELRYYPQLYASVLEFKPDLILEVGRGFGNSTCVFVAATKKLPQTRIVSVCLNSGFQRKTVPAIKAQFGEDWFKQLDARVGNIANQDIKEILGSSKRVLLYWDAHGLAVAEFMITSLFPELVDREHLIFIDDVIDREFRPQMHDYNQDSLWQPTFGEHTEFPYLFSERFCSAFDEIVPLVDFAVRNQLEIKSIEREMRRFFSKSYRKILAQRVLGKDVFSLYSKAHYFTMASTKREKPLSFPVPRAHLAHKGSVENEAFAAFAYSRQESKIKKAKERIDSLIDRIAQPSQLYPYQWNQLIALCSEFQPDLIIDFNSGNVSILGALLEGSQILESKQSRVITISDKAELFQSFASALNHQWELLSPTDATVQIVPHLDKHKRILVSFNSSKEFDTHLLLTTVLPELVGTPNLIVCHGMSDTRYLGQHNLEYSHSKNEKMVLGHLQLDNPNSIKIFDFVSRNRIPFHSGKKSFAEFYGSPSQNLIDSHFFWFSLSKEINTKYTFPLAPETNKGVQHEERAKPLHSDSRT